MFDVIDRFLRGIWHIFAEHWNVLLAGGSLIGLLVAEFWPPAKSYQEYFLFLCLNAVVWTLVAIKISIDKLSTREKLPQEQQFATLRSARRDILKKMKKLIQSGQKEEITIVGGRIRSIIEILREFRDECATIPTTNTIGVTIRLYVMNPSFVRDLRIGGHLDAEEQATRNQLTAGYVEASLAEVDKFSSDEIFKRLNIDIIVTTYDELPFGYYFLFGVESLIFGGFVWDEAQSDIIGPASPCWLIDSRSTKFEFMRRWLDSRVKLMEWGEKLKEQENQK